VSASRLFRVWQAYGIRPDTVGTVRAGGGGQQPKRIEVFAKAPQPEIMPPDSIRAGQRKSR